MARPRNVVSRDERVPMTGFETKLPFVKIPGFTIRMVNDKPGRLQRFEKAGWQFVTESEMSGVKPGIQNEISQPVDTRVSMVVDSETGMKAYLMKQKLKWYREDQKAKQDRITQDEGEMLMGLDSHGQPGQDGRFKPNNKLTVTKGGP